MADRAVLAHHVLVLEDDGRLRPVVVEGIGAARQVHDLVRLDAARARIHGIGTDAAERVDLERENGAVVLDGDLPQHPLVARMDVGQEALQPVRHELDRPLEQDREPDGRDLVRIGVDLDSERAADIARDDADPVLVQAEMGREDVLDHVRALVVVPHGELPFSRVPVREDGARLDAHPGVPGKDIGFLDDMVGLRNRRPRYRRNPHCAARRGCRRGSRG